jgi:hypothetical protein
VVSGVNGQAMESSFARCNTLAIVLREQARLSAIAR